MKRIVILILLSFLLACFCYSQNKIEYIPLNELKIIKPTIINLMNITNMDFSDFASEIVKLGYDRIGVDGEMVQYSTGSLLSTGKLEIKKSQYRLLISIIWVSVDGKRNIFNDLANDLTPFFKSIDGEAMIFLVDNTKGESYRFALKRETGSDLLLVVRIK